MTMTDREQKIVRKMLDVMHEADGAQFTEPLLHGEVYARTPCALPEFNACLAIVVTKGWVTGVENRTTKKMKWNINDAGEAARLEL